MTKTRRHMCMSIAGCLRNYKNRSMKGLFTKDDGSDCSSKEAREYLNECLGKGWKVIPMSEDCKEFDYQTGCPGHIIEE